MVTDKPTGTPTPQASEYEIGYPYLGQDGEVYLRSFFGAWIDSDGQQWEDEEMEDKQPLLQMFTKEQLIQGGQHEGSG